MLNDVRQLHRANPFARADELRLLVADFDQRLWSISYSLSSMLK